MNPRPLARFLAAVLLPLLAGPALSSRPAAAATPAEDYSQIHALYQQATAAYKQKDYKTYYAKVTRLGELFPNDSEVIFRRAAASALTGRTADAERLLRSLAARQAWFDVAGSPDFAAIRTSAAFRSTVAALAALKKQPIGTQTVAFRLAQKDFIPEAIAWDPATGSFLLSSVYHRKVVRVGKDGAVRELVPEGTAGLGSALGIAVDAPRRTLYVCSSTVKETRGARPEEIGRAALYAFHADSGKLLGRWPLGDGKAGHTCDSGGVSAAGEVYVSDGVTGEVSHLRRLQGGLGKAAALAIVIPPGTLVSAQSLAFPPGEKELLVADYGRGVFRVDLATRKATLLPIPPGFDLDGIDGMVLHSDRGGDSLIAVQNGLDPARVLRLRLSPGRDRIVKVETLARALPLYDEPGLATVAGGVLYYIANSQWGKFDDAGSLPATAKLDGPVILKIPL
jgi:sugar lactone lactonase YvrE